MDMKLEVAVKQRLPGRRRDISRSKTIRNRDRWRPTATRSKHWSNWAS